jgi:hypothetical protein
MRSVFHQFALSLWCRLVLRFWYLSEIPTKSAHCNLTPDPCLFFWYLYFITSQLDGEGLTTESPTCFCKSICFILLYSFRCPEVSSGSTLCVTLLCPRSTTTLCRKEWALHLYLGRLILPSPCLRDHNHFWSLSYQLCFNLVQKLPLWTKTCVWFSLDGLPIKHRAFRSYSNVGVS